MREIKALVADAKDGDKFMFYCEWFPAPLAISYPHIQARYLHESDAGHSEQVRSNSIHEEDGFDEGVSMT